MWRRLWGGGSNFPSAILGWHRQALPRNPYLQGSAGSLLIFCSVSPKEPQLCHLRLFLLYAIDVERPETEVCFGFAPSSALIWACLDKIHTEVSRRLLYFEIASPNARSGFGVQIQTQCEETLICLCLVLLVVNTGEDCNPNLLVNKT